MRFGYHLSISGGLVRALEQGMRMGCEAVQIFSRNPRSWASKPLTDEDAAAFRQARRATGLAPVAVHLPYLPNLGAADDELYARSIRMLGEELVRAARLGAEYVVTHPGHVGTGERRAALERVVRGVVRALAESPASGGAVLLLENTAGQRGEIGATFEELGGLLADIEAAGRLRDRVGVCLDTAHAWGAGYDLGRGLEATLRMLDRTIGLDRLHLIHLNDSLSDLGGRRDRHAVAGRGRIGGRRLAGLVRHRALSHLAGIMESPRQTEAEDIRTLRRVKRWRGTPPGARGQEA